MKRLRGFYWVKTKSFINGSMWHIMYFGEDGLWESPFFEASVEESYLTEIHEVRIKNPDEQ